MKLYLADVACSWPLWGKIEGLRVGQPKMKYWKLRKLHNNEVQMCINMGKNYLNFEQFLKQILRVFPSFGGGGGGKFNSVGLDHSGSQPFSCTFYKGLKLALL